MRCQTPELSCRSRPPQPDCGKARRDATDLTMVAAELYACADFFVQGLHD